MKLAYKRIVLKVSGESLGSQTASLDRSMFRRAVKRLVELHDMGVEIAVVVGGGNLLRGNQAHLWGIDEELADQAGMAATGVNAKLLAGMLAGSAVPAEVFARGACHGTPYNTVDVKAALSSGAITILAGGLGVSGMSTDIAAVQSAHEVGAQAVIMSKFGTDGVYTADPRRSDHATFLPRLNATDALRLKLAVMDEAALALVIRHKVRVHVVGADDESAVRQVLEGISIGSLIEPP
jgi:uridylate kinase